MWAFMGRKGYSLGPKHVWVIQNWQGEGDERILTDEERSHYNKEIVAYIQDELMHGLYDFSLFEVNQ